MKVCIPFPRNVRLEPPSGFCVGGCVVTGLVTGGFVGVLVGGTVGLPEAMKETSQSY